MRPSEARRLEPPGVGTASEGNIVVAEIITRRTALPLARLAVAEEDDLVGDDLDAVAPDIMLVGPAAIVAAPRTMTFWPFST
jgi:hypothetical protein